jgi:hypothetical protein
VRLWDTHPPLLWVGGVGWGVISPLPLLVEGLGVRGYPIFQVVLDDRKQTAFFL